jgi:hypothetical protein
MRVIDILLESQENSDVNSDLQSIVQSAEVNPKAAQMAKRGLDSIINNIKKLLKKAPKPEPTAQQVQPQAPVPVEPQEVPVEPQAPVQELPPEQPLQESIKDQLSQTVETLKIYLDEIGKLPNADMIMNPILGQISELEKQISDLEAESIRKGFKSGQALAGKPLGKQIEEFKERIKDSLNSLPQLEGQDEIKGIFQDRFVGLLGQGIDHEEIFSFINICSSANRLIDLPSIISNEDKGSVLSGDAKKYEKILRNLSTVQPFTGASTGQGEWLLVMIGKDTFKANPGDIIVKVKGEDRQVELKASGQGKSKSAVTDFTLGAILDVKKAGGKMFNAIEAITGKKIKRIPQINAKNLLYLNPIFVEMNQKDPGSVQNMFRQVFSTVYPSDDMADPIEEFVGTIPDSGELNIEEMRGAAGMLASEYYKIVNKHDVLMTMNIPTLTFACTANHDTMRKLIDDRIIHITSLLDFRERPGNVTFKHNTPKTTKEKKELQEALKLVDQLLYKYF